MKICLSCEGVTDAAAQRCGNCGSLLLPTDAVHYPVRRGELDAGHPLLGTVIDGKYRLLSVLGRGGLGTVFRAQHIGSLVSVALKLLHPRFAQHRDYRRALLPEARRAATVADEHCARLLDVGEGDEGISYLAMELVEGQTLDDLLRHGPFAPSHAIDVLIQVAEALAAIHTAGLVHCDLSPRNVMVAVRGGRLEVKVLDFGIARRVTLAGERGSRGEFAGFANPAFSAPELLAGGAVDERADLYSFGTLAWLLLTGSMPVDDADARRAATAVREGRLLPWPRVPGVPRRIVALVRQCLRQDPDERPASADDVRQRLTAARVGRGPLLARLAAFAAGLAVVAALAGGGAARPSFLRARSGSAIALTSAPLPPDGPVIELNSRQLRQLEFLYAGIAPGRLRAEISRHGLRLAGRDLRPEVNASAGTLVLSMAQNEWREVVQGLQQTSRDGPVDLAFVVPGPVLLGSVRLRVDDDPPALDVQIDGAAKGIRGDTRLGVTVVDDVGVATASATLEFARGDRIVLPLPPVSGEVALGRELFAATRDVDDLGPGELLLTATDRAGNTAALAPIPFAFADVGAPHVAEVTGPAGESFVSRLGDRVRLRVRLSSGEPGCELRCFCAGAFAPIVLPLAAPLGRDPVWIALELPASALPPSGTELAARFVVVDRAGNEAAREFALAVRDRSLLLGLQPERGELRWDGEELIASTAGGTLRASVGPSFALAGARLAGAGAPTDGQAVTFTGLDVQHARIGIADLAPGTYGLLLQVDEIAGEAPAPVERRVPLRVLPAIEVRVPAAAPRFLRGLVQAGVLAQRDGDALGEGSGWRLDPALRPYVSGTLWVGADAPAPLPIAAAPGPLLPDVVPVPGRNLLAIELYDALDRRVPVLRDDAGAAEPAGGRAVVADFWWQPGAPETIGERLLVEHGQPARVRLRLPLPFHDDELAAIRLGIAQGEVAAVQLTPADGGRCVAMFEVPFAVWSVAAQLADQPREAFARQLERRIEVYVETPAARYTGIVLRLVTTRSTLAPMALGELRRVPAALAGIRLLPVLAPAAAFAEPVPASAPPRALFRPQVAVAVRNMPDILLQDRELTWGEARGIAAVAANLGDIAQRSRCVHHDDPLGNQRLLPGNLLPPAPAGPIGADGAPPDDATLTGVDFYQAWTMCRLLGIAVAGDPALFRLPLGCELELAGYSDARRAACHAAAAHGGGVSMEGFAAPYAGGATPWPSAARCRTLGDVVPTSYGEAFVGLDFGVREWVYDLPSVASAEPLLREWLADHGVHLRQVRAMAFGVDADAAGVDPLAALRMLGVVRGLAFGEVGGLVGARGERLAPGDHRVLPDVVPGVLRAEQLRRDGGDLLQSGREPRLRHVGLRIAGNASDLARLWGFR